MSPRLVSPPSSRGALAASVLGLCLVASACGPRTVVVGTGQGAPSPNTPISPIVGGAGGIDPGKAGYIITANVGSFRFTWTGYAEFRGSLFADPNAIGSLTAGCIDGACSLASGEDVIRVSPNEPGRIDFVSFPASGKRSGFDVQILSNVVYVDLLVNGARRADLVEFVSLQNNQPFQSSASTLPLGLQVFTANGILPTGTVAAPPAVWPADAAARTLAGPGGAALKPEAIDAYRAPGPARE